MLSIDEERMNGCGDETKGWDRIRGWNEGMHDGMKDEKYSK